MHVVELPKGCGPFFLDASVYRKASIWSSGHPSKRAADHKLLVLTGPIKCGKSRMLEAVLPGLVMAQHAVQGGPTPVFFSFSFTLDRAPREAAREFVQTARRSAAELGITLSLPSEVDEALSAFPEIMGKFSAAVAALNRELVMLLDEAQVSN